MVGWGKLGVADMTVVNVGFFGFAVFVIYDMLLIGMSESDMGAKVSLYPPYSARIDN